MAHVSTIPGGGYPNLPACLREAAARTDRGITFIERAGEEETLSYRQLLDLALGTLVRLRENGVAAGHELVIQVERNRDFVVLYWACLLGKIVAVPLSPGTQEDHRIKLLKVWNKLNCPTLVCDPAQLDRIKKFGAEAGHEAACAAIAGRCLFPDLIGPAATPPLLPEVDPGDIAFIQFSSGSTGDPKGVVLTHRNLVANVSDIISRSEITPHDSLLSWMPLTHDMGLICFHLTGVVAGVAQALLPTALFVKRPLLWLHKASTHGATLLYSPNFGLQYALAALPPQTNLGWDLSRVRLIYNGAEPISYALCGRFAQALAPYGLPQGVIFPGYGMAEASVAVTLPPVGTPLTPCHAHRHFLKVGDPVRELPDADQPEAVTFVEVGRPVAQCAVRIAGDADESLPPRTVGHIQIRGANVTAGYYNDPRQSARVCTPDGWVRTGDLGFLRDGRLVITGRQKDIIIANGQNYYPHDIERSVYTRPELALELGKVAACGVRNPGTSRDDLVIFVLHKGSPEAFAPLVPGIREAVAAGIGLSVEAVVPVRRLPKTTSGKVQYFKLREQFGNGAFDELVTRLRQLAAPASGNDPIDGALTDRLLSLWHRTFPGTPLAENDNFFAGGLSSLQLTQFAAAVCTHTGRAVPLSCLFEHPSIGQLAAALAGGHEAAPGTIPRLAPAADYGVSPVQKRFWLLSEYEQEQVPLNLAVAYRLRGTLCVPSLLKALTALVHRHESLRTTYVNRDGEIRQRIAAPGAEGFAPRYVEASDAPNAPERALAEPECDANRRFDLATGPLLRATLTKTGPRDYLLALVMHHIAVDGWSITRMLDELAGSYRSLRAGEADLLPPLSMGPKDYTAWLAGASEATGTAGGRYWADALPAAPGRLPLPTYRPRPALKTYRGASLQFAVDPATAAGMGRVSRTHASSLFVTLTAALNVLLYKYTGQTDLVIGTTTAGRERPEVQALVGLLIHTLPVRTRIAAGGSFTDLQRAVKAYMAGAYAHEGHPFEQFLTEWQPQADPGRSPLFDVLLVLQDFDDPFARLAEDLSAERVEVPVHSGLVDLEFTFVRAAGALSFRIRYDRDLFTPEQVERMGGHLCRLMAEIAADPAAPVGRLRMLTAAEEAQLDGFNPLPVAYPARTVVELFEAQAASTPDAVAVLCAGRTLTYRQLNEAANRQAHLLRRDFLPQPDDCFAVMLPPGEDRVVALLAILKAGAAYLPIDPEWPALRTQHVLADRRPRLLYTQGAAAEAALAGLPLLRVEDLPRQAAGLPATNPGVPIAPGQLAYCLYTSGSTGTPKGIHVEHGALADYVQTFADYFEVAATDAVLQQASLAFDTSVEEIYPVLCRGGRLVVLPGGARDVDALRDHLAAERVTLLSTTPLVIEQLNRHGELPAGLRVLISGGDELRPAYLTRLLGKTAIYNTYGPTESTVCALYHRVETLADAPLLGRPIANRRVYVLDGDLQRVPVGVSGQICLAGRGLARGYVQAHLDAGRFVADPFAAGERMYLTGDRGKWLPDGRIAFEGRLDHQLKINGYRVEPGEIEQVLLTHPAVAQAVVTGHYTAGGTPFLAVHYRSHAPLTPADLRRFLAGRLPAYMVPGQYVALAQFPLLPGGKVDRGQLRLPATAAPATGYTPRTGVESRLAAIWTELLGGERVDPEGSFFLLGGNSLKATQLINQVYAALGVRLTLKAIFETPVFADLAARLAQERSSAYPAIRPVGRKKHYPLSWAQQQLWLLLQTIPDPAVYNISGAYRLSGRLHREALEDAFRAVVARHAALRTTFVTIDGTPRQRVHDPAGYPFRVEYRDVRTTADPAGEAERIFGKLARRRFDPQGGPLFAATLVRTGASEHVLVFCIHHIVADGWSLQVLLREFVALYSARVTGGADPLPDAPRLQYPDYAAWQRHYLSPARLRRHQAYWLSRLAGPLPILDLPARWPRPAVRSYRGGAVHGAIDQPGVVDALRALAQGHECTLFMVVLAAVKALLYRYSRQTDLIVGSPVSGRRHGDLEDQIGYYVNVLPLRTVLDGNWSFGRLLREVQATVVDAYDHQDYPFYRLVDDLDLAGDPSRSPVFDVMVAFEDLETGRRLTDLPGLTVSPCVPREVTAKFDLVFTLRELPHALAVTVEYSQDLFDASYATRLLGHLQTLFAAIAPGGPAALDALPYLPAAEAEALLTGFNAAPDLGQRLAHPSIETLLVEQVRATPDAPALQSGRASMSYRELGERVDQLAAGLAGHGIGPGHVVGVMIGRSFEMMIAILGIIRAGAAYLPIDPDYPAERVRFLLEHSRTRYVLVGPESAGPLPGGTATPLEVNALLAGSAGSAPPTLPAYGADRLLYVLYTSGSTGQPKGVMVTMHAFVNLLDWYVNELGIGPGDRNLLIAPTSFDLAQKNLFAPLVTGGTLHLLRPGPYDYAGIADTIESAGITTINCAPAAFYPILEENAGTQFRKLRSLRSVVLGGEPINLPKFLPWMEAPSGGAVLFNSYGPTECTDVVSAYRVQPADYRTLTSVPIGKPLPRVKLYVLDEGLQPLPVGHPGELYIGGVALSRGYFNNPALTREKFPETPHLPCPRLYRTGDLVKWLPDGNIAFLGRRDFQVKVRGYRIEPAEVKEALLRCPGLHEACVVPLDEAGEKVLAGYYTGERRVSPATLRTFLKKRLPAYMVPAYLVRVKAFPLTPNGKVDFNALPKPADVRTPASAAAPRSPLETTLLALWREVLGREGVGINDNFFDAGGHSLKATRLVLRIHQELHVRLEVKDVFARPTVARLARLITGRTPEAYRAIEPVAPQAHYPLSRAQRRLWLVHQFEQVQGAYHIGGAYEFDGPIDGQALAHTFDALVRRHEILRTVFVTVGGEPRQVVQAPGAGDPILACLDLDGQPGGEALVAALARREADAPFDLERGPLLRARLVRLGDRKSVLLFTMHHLIADGWSVQVLVQEVLALYKTFRRGGNPGLAPLRVQYKDYAAWQAAFLAQPGLHKHRRYWLGQLAGPLPVLPLPTDYPRPPVKTYPGALLRADLDDGVSRALYRWSRRQGTTLFVTLFAATNALLYGLTGTDDIVVGLPLAGRNHPDLEGQIGFYVNTLPIRTRMRADTPFKGLVRQVKTQLLRADKHQAYPLDGLPADLNLARDVSRSPLFDVLIESVNRDDAGESITALDGIAGRACPVEVTTSKFDLAFRFSEEAGRVTVALEYNTDLFGQSTIQSFRQRLDALLREVAARPAARLGDLCPPPGAEVPGNAYEAAEVDALFSNIF